MSEALSATPLALCQKAARLLTGAQRRAHQAAGALVFCEGNARQAEAIFGWGRETVSLGLCEARSGLTCLGNFQSRGGRPPTRTPSACA